MGKSQSRAERFLSHLEKRLSFRGDRRDIIAVQHDQTEASPGISKHLAPVSYQSPGTDKRRDECGVIESLPPEILLAIFSYYREHLKTRIILTHVCRYWRGLLLNAASFWSSVQVIYPPAALYGAYNDKSVHDFLSILRTELGRTATAPLDVTWTILPSQINSNIVGICSQFASFSRWRSFVLLQSYRPHHDNLPFGPNDSFKSLESLVVQISICPTILEMIARTSTRLRLLDVRTPSVASLFTDTPTSDYQIIMGRISHLILPKGRIVNAEMDFPPNIVDVEAGICHTNRLPHLLRLKLFSLILGVTATQKPDFRTLTNLTVADNLELLPGCEALLPSLRYLSVMNIHFGEGATLNAPKLESICILPGHGLVATRAFLMRDMIQHPGYLLSPMKSLKVSVSLPPQIIAKLLERSPQLQCISLCFDDELCSREMMDRILGEWPLLTMQQALGSAGLCPQLSELRLSLRSARPNEIEFWKMRASQAKEKRSTPEKKLAILASWKGEGSYTLLS